MLNEENAVQATEEEVTVQEEAVAAEEVAPVEETAVAEETVFEEVSEDVAVIQRHNEAVAYLRRKDCEMLTTLRDHLGENIRLHNILARINAEIDRLKALLKTPKPKTKVLLIIFGIIIAVGGMLLCSDRLPAGFYASLGVGAALIILAIVLKVLGNKKWAAFIAETEAKIAIEEQNAAVAQKNIDDYWRDHAAPYIMSIIPDRFPKDHVLEYDIVCGMLRLMENLRADTVKEAINLYDERCFRLGMRASFRNMESSLYDAARSAERTAKAAERSAAANESAAASAALTAASAASMAASAARAARASERASDASIDASRAIRDRANRDY